MITPKSHSVKQPDARKAVFQLILDGKLIQTMEKRKLWWFVISVRMIKSLKLPKSQIYSKIWLKNCNKIYAKFPKTQIFWRKWKIYRKIILSLLIVILPTIKNKLNNKWKISKLKSTIYIKISKISKSWLTEIIANTMSQLWPQ